MQHDHSHHDHALTPAAASAESAGGGPLGFFTNHGLYMPRVHCVQNEAGSPDWPWIIAILSLTSLVILGYARIFLFWRKRYLAEEGRDRNRKLMELAYVFLACGTIGYGFSMLAFFWPGYRLLAVLLVGLVVITWKFAWNLDSFGVSLSANRLQRELGERERQLAHRAHRAEEASRAKSAFLANMSHEIRTPMTAITGFTELLEDEDLTPDERAGHVRTVRRNADHLLGLINDILDLSKVESGKMTLAPEPVALGELVAETAASLRHRAARKGLSYEVRVQPELPKLTLDPTRLRQVLYNLIGNALKFTTAGGVVIKASYHGGDLTLEVIDTGIGIGPVEQASVFEPFVQADVSTTRRFGGTGLGLAIVRQTVELMDGTVALKSELGMGTTITLTIPAEVAEPELPAVALEPVAAEAAEPEPEPEPATAAPAPATTTSLDGLQVLLVEDGPDNQRLISHHLRRAGADVSVAGDGAAALEQVKRQERLGRDFDLVLMDMQMPILDGYETTTRLKGDGFEPPIVALTAHALPEDRDRCLAAGCDGFLTKPITRATLIDAVAAHARAA